MKKFFSLFILLFVLSIYSGCDKNIVVNNSNIVINEVCSNNASTLPTKDYEYYDWVELYNPSEEDVYLKNYGISDKRTNQHKFKLPGVTIKAKGYVVIYFNPDGEDKENLVAGFGIAAEGEELFLAMPNGQIINSVTVPALSVDTTYGRYYNGTDYEYNVLNPSPNAANESVPVYKFIEAPKFSHISGFYEDTFQLELSSDSNVEIYYTLDCSTPTKESIKYDGSIEVKDLSNEPNTLISRTDTSARGTNITKPVDKGFVVRAIAISEDGNQSEVITNTYFIDKDNYKNGNVLSLVTDPGNLVDENYGIYVKGKAYTDWEANGSIGEAPEYNWDKTGRDWERECNFSLIEKGTFNFSQDCGMRIHGFGGRTYYIKSFNIYARNCYGEKYLKDPLFDGFEYTKSLVLKYDRYSPSKERYRDGFLQSLMADTNVATQEYKMCTLFLNGEYYKEYMIMEKYTDDAIACEYDVVKEDVVIIKEGSLEEGTQDDYLSYRELINFARGGKFEQDVNYRKLCELIDVDSFIDFYATQLYYNHFDFSYYKNVLVWKTRKKTNDSYGDGKWRWMLYDFDYAAADTTISNGELTVTYDYKFDTFNGEFLFAGEFRNDVFFHSFMKNKKFKDRFVSRFMDLANTNFNKDVVAEKLLKEYGAKGTTINKFFDNRYEYIVRYLANYLQVENDVRMVNVITNQPVKFNSINLNSNFTGGYLASFNLTLEANKNANVTFRDVEVVSSTNGVYVLRISGNNPTISIS